GGGWLAGVADEQLHDRRTRATATGVQVEHAVLPCNRVRRFVQALVPGAAGIDDDGRGAAQYVLPLPLTGACVSRSLWISGRSYSPVFRLRRMEAPHASPLPIGCVEGVCCALLGCFRNG